MKVKMQTGVKDEENRRTNMKIRDRNWRWIKRKRKKDPKRNAMVASQRDKRQNEGCNITSQHIVDSEKHLWLKAHIDELWIFPFYKFSTIPIRSQTQLSAIPSNPYTTSPHPAIALAISSTSHPHVSPIIPPIRAGQSTFILSAIFSLKFSCIRHTNHGKYSTTSQGTPHTSVALGTITPPA